MKTSKVLYKLEISDSLKHFVIWFYTIFKMSPFKEMQNVLY